VAVSTKTTEKQEKDPTMKLMTFTHVSVDGVMQGLGEPEEDPSSWTQLGLALATWESSTIE
jgi:hypothetical protein